MSNFIKTKSHRSFGSMWYRHKDIDGRIQMVPHYELINGEWVETKEYKAMKKWSETP